MSVLRILRYCVLSLVIITVAIQLPALITSIAGGDVQQWKWFSAFYGALSMMAAVLFAILTLVWHVSLMLTHRWQKTHG